MTSQNVTHIGQHLVWLIPPDIIVIEWHGEASAAQLREMYRVCEVLVPGSTGILGCNIMKDSTPPSFSARRAAAENPVANRFRAHAFVGATFHFRVIATMIAKAHQVLRRGNTATLAFFDELPEALEWLASQRRGATVMKNAIASDAP